MKATGIVRRIDELGRVVIPKEIRRTQRIRRGDPLEIFTTGDGEVIFKKYSPIGEMNAVAAQYTEVLSKSFALTALVADLKVREYSDKLIAQYDVRSGQGSSTIVRSMSGGNQQKAIIAREIDKDPKLLVAVQPTRGLDVGAIEYIHRQIVAERDKGKAVLLVSLELDEVMNLSDRILVMYEGEIVGEFDPKTTTVQELGLYMAGARKQGKESK